MALTHHYKFNETSGTAADDNIGGADLAGLAGSWVSGKVSNAYQCNNETIDCGFKGSVGLGSNCSISFWIKRHTGNFTDWARIVTDGNSNANAFGFLTRSSNAVRLVSGDGNAIQSTSTIGTSDWVWVCGVFDTTNNSHILYINNTQEGSTGNFDTTFIDTNLHFWGGTGTAEKAANLDIDDLRFYSHALSAAERNAIYNSGNGSETAGEGPDYTKLKVNIGDSWKSASNVQINIGDAWKTVIKMEVNIGDAWKTVFSS